MIYEPQRCEPKNNKACSYVRFGTCHLSFQLGSWYFQSE